MHFWHYLWIHFVYAKVIVMILEHGTQKLK